MILRNWVRIKLYNITVWNFSCNWYADWRRKPDQTLYRHQYHHLTILTRQRLHHKTHLVFLGLQSQNWSERDGSYVNEHHDGALLDWLQYIPLDLSLFNITPFNTTWCKQVTFLISYLFLHLVETTEDEKKKLNLLDLRLGTTTHTGRSSQILCTVGCSSTDTRMLSLFLKCGTLNILVCQIPLVCLNFWFPR